MQFTVSQMAAARKPRRGGGRPFVIAPDVRWRIKNMLGTMPQSAIAAKFGVTRTQVADISRRVRAGRES